MTKTSGNENFYHAVSLSGGKDSSALLLLMIEKGMPIDAVISADTGMEFPEMYNHLAKLDDLLYRERGIHITTLRHPHGFEWLMFDEPKQKSSCLENRARAMFGPGPLGQFKKDWSVERLEERFAREEKALSEGTGKANGL